MRAHTHNVLNLFFVFVSLRGMNVYRVFMLNINSCLLFKAMFSELKYVQQQDRPLGHSSTVTKDTRGKTMIIT